MGEEDRFSCRETAGEPGMSEAAMRVAIHRLRRRFGELVREEIAQTFTSDEEVEVRDPVLDPRIETLTASFGVGIL